MRDEHVRCPSCESTEVVMYRPREAGVLKKVSHGRCDDCFHRWTVDGATT